MFVKRTNFISVILNFFRNSRFFFFKDALFNSISFFFSYLFINTFNDFIHLTNFVSSFSFKTTDFLFYSIDESDKTYCWNYANREVGLDKSDKCIFDKVYCWDCANKKVDLDKLNKCILVFFEYLYSFIYIQVRAYELNSWCLRQIEAKRT